MTRVRFAPSPTGALHVGGARTALFNYLFAKKTAGIFVLRIDDTDRERSESRLEHDICEGLRWLGLEWDEGPDKPGKFGPYRQSDRLEFHIAAARELESTGKAYVDDGGALRLRYPRAEIVVEDEVCGRCVFQSKSLGPEPVILRSDGTPTYHLASVSDDIDMRISHVIRGQDHLTNSAKQVLIFEALGAKMPTFAHLPLILSADGSKLSKRNSEGLVSVNEFRSSGFLPQALVNFLMLLGWSHPEGDEHLSIEDACEVFSFGRVGKNASIFEVSKLNWLNAWWIKHLPIETISRETFAYLEDYQELVLSTGEDFWPNAVAHLRQEMRSLTDAKGIAELLVSESLQLDPEISTSAMTTETRKQIMKVVSVWMEVLDETYPESDQDCYNAEQFKQLISIIKKRVGFGGKDLFQAVRLAITGKLSGPELKVVLPFIRRELLVERAQSLMIELQKN